MKETKKCCICGKEIKGWGNNPEGAVWKTYDGDIELPEFGPFDRCCDECNAKYVVPGRIYCMGLKKEAK